jgi:AAA family ATP:ADP antiporter
MASVKLPLPAGAVATAVVSAAMIAQQVAGKATRDTLFLTSFDVKALPSMMAVSALLSIVAVLWLSKLILRHSPAKVVPASFAVSGMALLGAWALSFPAPRLAAVAVYLQTALFGASVISAFWSFVNERFDPRTGKRAVAFIAGGGTLGGVVGGVLAWRAASVIAVPTMLPLLAAMNLVCLWGCLRSRDSQTLRAADPPLAGEDGRDRIADGSERVSMGELSPLRILREAPYLQNLALVVALGAVTSGLLDYVFSAEAVRAHAKGPDLLSFFALFWLAVGVLSLALQTLLGRIALERLGLAVTIGLLPGVVVLGGVFGLAVPGLWSTAILRGGEAAQRNSLFRAAYELLYTPLSEQKRRSTKLLIDVGFDRLGTVTASVIAFLTLQLQPDGERASGILLVITVACALATLTRSRPLHTGYVAVLEESLRMEAKKMEPRAEVVEPPSTRESVEVRDEIVEQLQDLPRSVDLAALATVESKDLAVPLEVAAPAPIDVKASLDASLAAIHDLTSGSPQRVRSVLAADTPLASPLVPFAILLLASGEFHLDAIRALRQVARRATGQLADALCDPSVAFDIRRRIARVLSACPTQAAADALIRGTEDERFEVRYECGRALLRITASETSIVISLQTVIAIVGREVAQSKDVWESQCAPEFDDEEGGAPALIDRLLRDRLDRSLEHVFSILALVLDRESIRIAFKALHQEDERLRGTALEYLETVLPDEIRDAVWPFLGEARPMRPARPANEILADLMNAREKSREGPRKE